MGKQLQTVPLPAFENCVGDGMSAEREEPKLRLYDLRIVIELLVEAVESKDGARDRVFLASKTHERR